MRKSSLRPAAIRLGFIGIAAIAASCGHSAKYTPTEASSRAGGVFPASYYQIDVDDKTLGNVRIWSQGGYEEETNGKRAVISIGVRIRNISSGPITLQLERTDLDITVSARRPPAVLSAPTRTSGSLTVPAGQIERVLLVYELPSGLEPDDIQGFELNWVLETPAGTYAQSTPFMKVEYRQWPGYYWPYSYYGWGYPYWGGWGYYGWRYPYWNGPPGWGPGYWAPAEDYGEVPSGSGAKPLVVPEEGEQPPPPQGAD